jgi:hypothetical protein
VPVKLRKQVIDKDKPARVFVDVGGVGAGVYDRLVEMGYGKIVKKDIRQMLFDRSEVAASGA